MKRRIKKLFSLLFALTMIAALLPSTAFAIVDPNMLQLPTMAAGYQHGLAITKSDGSVRAWGWDAAGQLGVDHPLDVYSIADPVTVPGLSDVIAVSGGYTFSLALKSDGTVWAWGQNNEGQLGDGSTVDHTAPAQVHNLANVVSIAAGRSHGLALKSDGTVWAWGYGYYGQLGNNLSGVGASSLTPVEVLNLTGVKAVSASNDGHYSLALKQDGTVWSWGLNQFGMLGDGTSVNSSVPVQAAGLGGITRIAAGYFHALAVDSGGNVYAWGDNGGNFGNGITDNSLVPVSVGLTGIADISAGNAHSLFLKNDGTVLASGRLNSYGELGNGTTVPSPTPVAVNLLTSVVAVAAGNEYSLALKSDGTVYGWGSNMIGQLGVNNPAIINATGPLPAALPEVLWPSYAYLAEPVSASGSASGTVGYSYISVDLTSGTFSDNESTVESPANWTLGGSHGGTSISGIDRQSATSVRLTLSANMAPGDTYTVQAAAAVFASGTAPFAAPVNVTVYVPQPATGTAAAAIGEKDIAVTLTYGSFGSESAVEHAAYWTLGGASAAGNPIASVTKIDSTHATVTLTNSITASDTYTITASQPAFVNIAVAPFASPLDVVLAVCQIGAAPYTSLDAALATVGANQTAEIKLLKSITYNNGILIDSNRHITFDLNGHTLEVVNAAGVGLTVMNGTVGYTGTGAFNVTGKGHGVVVSGVSASATVTNATGTGDDTDNDGAGALASAGGIVTVNGDALGTMYGVYATGTNTRITVGGDATATAIYSHGVHTESDGTVQVNGNVQGTQYGIAAGYDTIVTVSGNVTATALYNGFGVNTDVGATVSVGGSVFVQEHCAGAVATGISHITIGGNINAPGFSSGASAIGGGTITVDGKILIGENGTYISLTGNSGSVSFVSEDGVVSISSPGYLEYTDSVNTVWVKVPAPSSSVTWASGYPKTFNVLDESFILQVSADEICTVYYVVLPDSASIPSAAQVAACQDASGNTVSLGSNFSYDPDHIYGPIGSDTILHLTPSTAYDVYVVAKDSAGVLKAPVLVDVTTLPDIDTVPNDAKSGITGLTPGAAGSRQVTLTIQVKNAAGDPLTGIGPGYFEAAIDGGAAERFDLSPMFSAYQYDSGDGIYTIVFTGAADNTVYTFTNLTVFGALVEAGPYTVTTPPAAPVSNPPASVAVGTSYVAEVEAGTQTGALQVVVNNTTDTVSAALSGAQAEAYFAGGSVRVTMPAVSGMRSYVLGVPGKYLSVTGVTSELTLDTGLGTLVLPTDMLASIANSSGKQAEISIGAADTSGLSDSLKAAIGTRPVVQLELKLDGQQTDWNNPTATVRVTIPYTPTAEELANPESIVVWYIDGSGNAVMLPNGHYDAAKGCVTFETTHFSRFAAGYSRVLFSDIPSGSWYAKAVDFIAARGITTGTGGGKFSPGEKLTRGEFIVMLMQAYGISPDDHPENNFTDAGGTWYTNYLAAAKRLGISAGVGGNMFAPGQEITRQELFTMLYNALKLLDKLPAGKAGNALSAFSDAPQIAAWAKPAMALFAEAGTISGSDGRLYPTDTTTRAEMAQVLFNLLSQ